MKRVLVAYSAAATYVPTTLQYLCALKDLANYEVKFVHVTHDARLHFDINEFDVLINSYCARLCLDEGYLSPSYIQAMLSFQGLKIAIVQDDYDRTFALHRAIRHLGFHVLFTSIQSEFWPIVYPKIALPGVALRHLSTGYAPVPRCDASLKPLVDRPIPIAYRGRQLAGD